MLSCWKTNRPTDGVKTFTAEIRFLLLDFFYNSFLFPHLLILSFIHYSSLCLQRFHINVQFNFLYVRRNQPDNTLIRFGVVWTVCPPLFLCSFRPAQSSREDPQQRDLPVCQPVLHGRKRHSNRFHHLHPKVHRVPVRHPGLQRQHLHGWAVIRYVNSSTNQLSGAINKRKKHQMFQKLHSFLKKLFPASWSEIRFNASAPAPTGRRRTRIFLKRWTCNMCSAALLRWFHLRAEQESCEPAHINSKESAGLQMKGAPGTHNTHTHFKTLLLYTTLVLAC